MNGQIPHARTVIAFCIAAIAGYAIFSVWAIFWSNDAAIRGDVGGTWKSFAVAAFAFWIGSSSGGKSQTTPPTPVEGPAASDTFTPLDLPEPYKRDAP